MSRPERTASWPRTMSPVLAIAAVYVAALTILRSAAFAAQPTVLSGALAFDLCVTTSALVWWLGVRRAGWPSWTVGATFGAGLLVARSVLPDGVVVTALVGVWLAGESLLALLALARLRTIVQVARGHRGPGPVAAVEAGLLAARLPARLAAIIASDVVAVGLGLGGWFRRAPADGFAMHRRKSWTAIAMLLLGLLTVETVAVHLLIAHWSPVAAWIATALSAYGALWFAADLHALRLYPLRVTDDAIVVSIGLRWRLTIPRDAITAVTLGDTVPGGALAATVVEPTLILTLARPIEVRGLFGIRRSATTIALTIDEPERLIARLAAHGPPDVSTS